MSFDIRAMGAVISRLRWGVRRVRPQDRISFVREIIRRALVSEPLASRRFLARRVVFVCHGNVMRSAFACSLWNADRRMGDEQLPEAVSAGTHATTGRPALPMAIAAAAALSVKLEDHRATNIEAVGVEDGDLLVAFDCETATMIRRFCAANASVQLLLLGDVEDVSGTLRAEIRDPWGTSVEETIATFCRIRIALRTLQSTITLVADTAG